MQNFCDFSDPSDLRVLLLSGGAETSRIPHTELVNAAASGALAANAKNVFLAEEDENNGVLAEYLQPIVRLLPADSLTRCQRDLGEFKAFYQDHHFGAAVFLGYHGLKDLKLLVNGIPTTGLGLLAETLAALGVPVVACLGDVDSYEEVQKWMPRAAFLAIHAARSLEETNQVVREVVKSAVLERTERKRGVLSPPFEFEYSLSKPLDFSTRPLLLDVTLKGQSFFWSTWDFLYGWKVFWNIHSRYGAK